MDAIDRRRSIRRFSDKEIPHEVICKIVESGIKGHHQQRTGSHGNLWSFRDRQKKTC